MTNTWLIASNNPYKTADLQAALDFYGLQAVPYTDVIAKTNFPSEGTASYAENARQKALYLWRLAKTANVIADDSGLDLVGLPQNSLGVTTKRTLHQQTKLSDNQAVLALADQQADRRATMTSTLVAITTSGREVTASGTITGFISPEERGNQSTGFDRIFQLTADGPTLAELPANTRIPLTHRGQAAKQLVNALNQEDD